MIIIKLCLWSTFQDEVQSALQRYTSKIPKSNKGKNMKGNIKINKENKQESKVNQDMLCDKNKFLDENLQKRDTNSRQPYFFRASGT